MPRSITMTLRLPQNTIARLDGLAKATERSRAYLASRAIEEYLATQEWQIQVIQEAVDAANKPDAVFLDHAEVLKKARSFAPRTKSRRTK